MVGNPNRFRPELADKLRELRRQARLSQAQLAETSGVSPFPIKAVEAEGHVPKATTLRQIADGLATYGDGRLDEQLAAKYFRELMVAAGYRDEDLTQPPLATPDAMSPAQVAREYIASAFGEDVAIEMMETAEAGGLGPEGKTTLANLLRMMKQAEQAKRDT